MIINICNSFNLIKLLFLYIFKSLLLPLIKINPLFSKTKIPQHWNLFLIFFIIFFWEIEIILIKPSTSPPIIILSLSIFFKAFQKKHLASLIKNKHSKLFKFQNFVPSSEPEIKIFDFSIINKETIQSECDNIVLHWKELLLFSSQILTVKSLEQDIIFSLKKITFPNQSLCASFIILFIIFNMIQISIS